MEDLSKCISELLGKGDVLCLEGDLGAGKTTFTQFLCKSMKVSEYVTSPTFNIMNTYDGILPIYHFDVYRISEIDEMYEIGFEDFLYGEGVCIIEWANLVESLIPPNAIWMSIFLSEESSRIVRLRGEAEIVDKIHSSYLGLSVGRSN